MAHTPEVMITKAASELANRIKVLQRHNRDLVAALRETTNVIQGELVTLIDSHTVQGDLSTLTEAVKPDFERFTKALTGARKAIKASEERNV
jgi:hypothetical protein